MWAHVHEGKPYRFCGPCGAPAALPETTADRHAFARTRADQRRVEAARAAAALVQA